MKNVTPKTASSKTADHRMACAVGVRRTVAAMAAAAGLTFTSGVGTLFLLSPVAAIAAPAPAAATVDASTPEALVSTLSSAILQTVKADPQIRAGNMDRIAQVVNGLLLPHTDFRKTTRLALGRYWREATPEQQDQLVQQFELLLIHTYAGATAKVGDQTVNVKPMRAAEGQSDVVVRTDVLSGGQSYQVDYRLEKADDGWKIYDVNVVGAWLIEAYRQQFSAQVQQNGVAGLLTFLQQRNQQLAARNGNGG